jgi:hypothetical protein
MSVTGRPAIVISIVVNVVPQVRRIAILALAGLFQRCPLTRIEARMQAPQPVDFQLLSSMAA